MDAVRVEDATIGFRGHKIFDKLNITIPSGSVFGLMGKNGTGKSVFFKAVCGLIPSSNGSIYIFGERVGKNGVFPASIGILIERPGILSGYSAADNLRMLGKLRGIADEAAIRWALTSVGLDPNSKLKTGKFSLGMKQKLGIAQAIFEKQKLIILDEPTNNLDEQSVQQTRDLIRHLSNDLGSTILLASHDREDIFALCDTITMIHEKTIVPYNKGE